MARTSVFALWQSYVSWNKAPYGSVSTNPQTTEIKSCYKSHVVTLLIRCCMSNSLLLWAASRMSLVRASLGFFSHTIKRVSASCTSTESKTIVTVGARSSDAPQFCGMVRHNTSLWPILRPVMFWICWVMGPKWGKMYSMNSSEGWRGGSAAVSSRSWSSLQQFLGQIWWLWPLL